MRLGIYGGTFSPVHNAHVRAAEAFLHQCRLDKLLIIPAGIPPHKAIKDSVTPEQRIDMCRLAFSDLSKTEVSDIELKRTGKSYTVMTVRELEGEDRELFLLCGTDMILTFDAWYCFEEILRKCTLVCIRRETDDDVGAELEEKIELYKEKYGAQIIMLQVQAMELSSTEVRDLLRSGSDVSSLVPHKIITYIKENNLYTN